ncbi:hypothetical protein BLOT_012152 [Blomia tropicalis]|nr:hypothetical protein BLOT_012152 [Blomia tropicalis]
MGFIPPLTQNRTLAKVTKVLVTLIVEIYNKTPIKTIHTDAIRMKISPSTCQCENCSKLPQVFKQFLQDQRNQRLEFIPEVIADQPLPISSQDTVCTIGTTSSFSVQETGWPIQRFVCLLRCVELPLRKLLLEIDSLPIGLAYGIQAGSTMDGIVYWMARTFWTRALKISFRGYN